MDSGRRKWIFKPYGRQDFYSCRDTQKGWDNEMIWIKKTLLKVVKTMAETALAVIGTNAVGITEVDWVGVLSAVALSGVVTILFNIKSIPEGEE